MKNRLFRVALVLLTYFAFVAVFTTADDRGVITDFLSKVGLTDFTAQAPPSFDQEANFLEETAETNTAQWAESSLVDEGKFLRRPFPPKPKPKPEPDDSDPDDSPTTI